MANKNTIEITLSVDDKGSVTVKQFGEGTRKAFQDTEKSSEDLSKSTSSLFSTMKSHWVALSVAGLAAVYGITKAIGGVISATREWIGLANEQESAEKRLEAVIRATGGAAGYTIGQLKEMASQMQAVTTVGDEVILSGMSILSTFRNIKGDVFKDASMAALDMVTVMRQGKVTAEALDSQMIQLGKALNDPVEGLAALSRVGVQFTAEQEATIKALVETGDVMGAQRIILEELKNEFGGAAAMMADTFPGASSQARNALGDLKEELGFVITKNQFFIDIQKMAASTFADWGNKIKNNREYLMSLTKDGILWLIDGLKTAINTVRFFHNAWLGLKIAANGAIHGIAVVLDELFRGLRSLGSPLDYIFQGLVKLGMIENNPFDKLEESLQQFRLSSGDVAEETWKQIEDTNKAYDKVVGTIENWKEKIKSVPAVQSEAADDIKKTLAGVSNAVDQTAAATHTSIREAVIAEKEFIASLAINQAKDVATAVKDVAKAVDETEQELTGLEEYWQHTYDNIHDATADFFYDILRDAKLSFDSIKDWFVRLIAEMLATAAANPIKIAIGSVMGVGAGGSALAGTGGGGASSLFDLSGISKLFSGIGAAGWGLTIPGVGVGGPMGMASGLGTTGALGAINWANVAGYLGLAYEAFNLFKSIGEGKYLTSAGIAIGAGIGAFLGGGPVGAALGAGVGDLVGGILDSIFGLGKDEPEFTLSEINTKYSGGAVGTTQWTPGKGISSGDWLQFEDDWESTPSVAHTAIVKAYAKGRKEIVENFNESMMNFMEALPDNYLSVVEDALAGMDFTYTLPGTRWEFKDAQEVVENLLLNYADFLAGKFDEIVNVVGAAYFEQDVSASELFGKLTTEKQAQVRGLLSAGGLTGEQFQSFLEEWQSLGTVMAGFEALLDPAIMQMTTYEKVVQQTGDTFDNYISTLERAGIAVDELGDLEEMRAEVIAREVKALQESFSADFQENMLLKYSGLSDYEKALYQLNKEFDEYVAAAKDLGMTEENLAEIEEWRTRAVEDLAEAEAKLLEKQKQSVQELVYAAQGFDSFAAHMKMLDERYGWSRDPSGYYGSASSGFNYQAMLNTFAKGFTIDDLKRIAEGLGIDWETIADDVGWLVDNILAMQEAAKSLGKTIEDQYYSLTMSSHDYGVYKATMSRDETLAQLRELYDQGFYSASEYNRLTSMTWTIFRETVDNLDEVNDGLRDTVREAESASNSWGNLVKSIQSNILGLTTGTANQADVYERLALAQQAIRDYTGGRGIADFVSGLGSESAQQEAIEDLMGLYNNYLSLAQEAYQRPSTAYQNIYDEILGAYQVMEDIALSEHDYWEAQLDYLRRIAENTSPDGSYATGTEYVPKTGIYRLHEGEKVIPRGESAGGDIQFTLIINGSNMNPREARQEFETFLRSSRGRKLVQSVAVGR